MSIYIKGIELRSVGDIKSGTINIKEVYDGTIKIFPTETITPEITFFEVTSTGEKNVLTTSLFNRYTVSSINKTLDIYIHLNTASNTTEDPVITKTIPTTIRERVTTLRKTNEVPYSDIGQVWSYSATYYKRFTIRPRITHNITLVFQFTDIDNRVTIKNFYLKISL